MRLKPADELTSTAYHEAGHAVAAWLLGVAVRKVTIVPTKELLGCCFHYPRHLAKDVYDDSCRARKRFEQDVMIKLAGGIAESRHTRRRVSEGSVSMDSKNAVDVALHVNDLDEKAAEAYLEWLYRRAKALFRNPDNWQAVKRIAAALLEHGTISGKQVDALMRQR